MCAWEWNQRLKLAQFSRTAVSRHGWITHMLRPEPMKTVKKKDIQARRRSGKSALEVDLTPKADFGRSPDTGLDSNRIIHRLRPERLFDCSPI